MRKFICPWTNSSEASIITSWERQSSGLMQTNDNMFREHFEYGLHARHKKLGIFDF